MALEQLCPMCEPHVAQFEGFLQPGLGFRCSKSIFSDNLSLF